jgi:hypothetical protein
MKATIAFVTRDLSRELEHSGKVECVAREYDDGTIKVSKK